MNWRLKVTLVTLLLIMSLCFPVYASKTTPTVPIRLLQTTDLHSHIKDFDYKKEESVIDFGFVRTASLIQKARGEVNNSLLFDSGDLIQGETISEYIAKSYHLTPGFIHPVFQALNKMDYDAATLGNHEFNYGLDYLQNSLQGANFPYVNANIFVAGQDINVFNPYVILDRKFIDTNNNKHDLKIGVIGFVTPITAKWDEEHLKGVVDIRDIVPVAEHYIPMMKEEGADLIIALAHTGLYGDKGLTNRKVNSVYGLSQVEGIDAILFGHTHLEFPGKDYEQLKGIDTKKGTINGIPAVQAGYWGNHLGVIDLVLQSVNGQWEVTHSKSSVHPIVWEQGGEKIPLVSPDPSIEKVIQGAHQSTIDFTD